MQHHVVQDTAECVACSLVLDRELACLGDRDAQRPGRVRMLLEDLLPELRVLGRGGVHLRTVHVHQGLPEGLLVVAALDHEHGGVDIEQVRDHGQGCPPLAGAGLCGEGVDSGLCVVVRLRQSSVPLVATERAHVLPLEVDLCRGLEILLQAVCPLQGGGPVQIDQGVADLLGDVDVPLCGALLLDDGLAEYLGEVLGLGGLLGDGVEWRSQRLGKVGREVVPSLGDLLGVECDACVFRYCHELC